MTDRQNAQLLTRYIKNWADSAEIERCSPQLTLCGSTGYCYEMPNFSYTQPVFMFTIYNPYYSLNRLRNNSYNNMQII